MTSQAHITDFEPARPPRRALPVSAAARLLGVSASSLRAWAAAGRVPHARTAGGHRRFDAVELERWLAERGGHVPPPAPAPPEPPTGRVEPAPELGRAVLAGLERVVEDAERLLDDQRPAEGGRPGGTRRSRLTEDVVAFAEGLLDGDLAAAFSEAEWQGFRFGAAGQSGEPPIGEALAVRRALDAAMSDPGPGAAGARRSAERALDRMVVCVAVGYAEGLRCRRRADAERA
jgi:excisionase family DNA binding protein